MRLVSFVIQPILKTKEDVNGHYFEEEYAPSTMF